MDKNLRKLNDMALAYGEKHLSPQTQFIQLKYHALDDEANHTIPLFENFLFSLALFQARTVENVTRAKALLEKLLYFQQEDGNFPLYLHEFPKGSDYYTAVNLLAPLYWIFHDFSSILGDVLKTRLEICLKNISGYCLQLTKEKKPPFLIRFQIASGIYAIAIFFKYKEMEEEAHLLLQEFKYLPKEAFSTEGLGRLIIGSQMVNQELLAESLLPNFLEHLLKTWNSRLCSYVGPDLFELQAGFEPECLFYDLFMGYITGDFSKRAEKSAPFHLQAVLIKEMKIQENVVKETDLEPYLGKIQNRSFVTLQKETYSFSSIEQLEALSFPKDDGFAPFKLKWGSKERLHTFSIEGGNCKQIESFNKDDGFEFFFYLDEVRELEEKEKAREIIFYVDLSSDTQISVDGIRANVFHLGNEVQVTSGGVHFSLKFELVDGKGQFLGHFMRGNRPSQRSNKGKERFTAFDAQIFIRTIRRERDCTIKASLEYIKT